MLHAVRTGWEPLIESFCPRTSGPHVRWSREDLTYLGLGAVDRAEVPPLTGVGEAWGARYVLEGSALGGRVLLRRVAALGFGETAGGRYLAGHGDETGAIWRGFVASLERVEDKAGVLRGAGMCFDALRRFSAARMN